MTFQKTEKDLHCFIGGLIPALLLLTTLSAHAAEVDGTLQESETFYTQEDIARLVAGVLPDRDGDPDAVSVEFTPALPTFRLPAGAGPIVVEDVSTDAAGRRFAARIAMPAGSGNIHRQTITGQLHRLAQVPVPTRAIGRGETIQAEDLEWVRMKDSRVGTSVIVDAADLVGRTARGPLRAGTPVRATQVRSPVVIGKGSTVLLVFEREGMALTARARALEDGGVGETIRVSNLQSSTVVEGTVSGPGRVDVSLAGPPRRGDRS